MKRDTVVFSVFTHQPDPDQYPAGLARAVHLSWTDESGERHPLNRDYGVLFANGEISPEDTIVPMGVWEPKIFETEDGLIGICAGRVYEDGTQVSADGPRVLLWKTRDLIHFEGCGLVPAGELEKWKPGESLQVDGETARRAIAWWSPVFAERAEVPEHIEAESAEQLADVTAAVFYSDGSSAEKKVLWDTDRVDFTRRGEYTAEGRILRQAFRFPLAKGYGDPVVFPWEGKWYFLATNDNLNDIGLYVREADSPEGLFEEGIQEHLILPFDPLRGFEQTFWAPEFHVIGGRLCILFAVSGHVWGPQCHVMRLKTGGRITRAEDWEDPVRVVRRDGRPLSEDGITLDMTYLRVQSGSYAVWSYRRHIGTEKDTGSMLYIARIREEEPWRLESDPVLLSRPLYGWENVAGTINNEGPYALIRDGQVYLLYSGGSANAYTYALGMLTARETDDLLDIRAWTKSIQPVLTFRSVKGEYGPGHHSFFINPQGETMIAYHAETGIGEHLRCDGIRRVHFRSDGSPYFQLSVQEDLPDSMLRVTIRVATKDRQQSTLEGR